MKKMENMKQETGNEKPVIEEGGTLRLLRLLIRGGGSF